MRMMDVGWWIDGCLEMCSRPAFIEEEPEKTE